MIMLGPQAPGPANQATTPTAPDPGEVPGVEAIFVSRDPSGKSPPTPGCPGGLLRQLGG